jgi:hypothetical protein
MHRGGAHAGGASGGGPEAVASSARLAVVLRLLHPQGLPPRDLPYAIRLEDVARHTVGSTVEGGDATGSCNDGALD